MDGGHHFRQETEPFSMGTNSLPPDAAIPSQTGGDGMEISLRVWPALIDVSLTMPFPCTVDPPVTIVSPQPIMVLGRNDSFTFHPLPPLFSPAERFRKSGKELSFDAGSNLGVENML